jgi:hypothetical protein
MAFIPVAEEVGAEVIGESAAEGSEASAEEDLGEPRGEHNLGNGNSMHFSDAQFRALIHGPAVVAAIMDRAQKCAEIANKLAITYGAKYAVKLQNKPDHTRPRAAIYAANFKAVIDEMYHSTLLKAAAQTGSDPKQTAHSASGEDHEGEGSDLASRVEEAVMGAAEGGEE